MAAHGVVVGKGNIGRCRFPARITPSFIASPVRGNEIEHRSWLNGPQSRTRHVSSQPATAFLAPNLSDAFLSGFAAKKYYRHSKNRQSSPRTKIIPALRCERQVSPKTRSRNSTAVIRIQENDSPVCSVRSGILLICQLLAKLERPPAQSETSPRVQSRTRASLVQKFRDSVALVPRQIRRYQRSRATSSTRHLRPLRKTATLARRPKNLHPRNTRVPANPRGAEAFIRPGRDGGRLCVVSPDCGPALSVS